MRVFLLLMSVAALSAPIGEAKAQIIYGNPNAVDGDTLDFGGGRVRLFGIDAPERSQTCQRASGAWECGADATALLASLIEGRRVQCEKRDTDRYGRPVAICSAGGIDLSEAMARTGFAIALERFSTDYVAMAEQARTARLGIWEGTFQEPAEFRAKDRAYLAETAEYERELERDQRQDFAASGPRRPSASGVYFRNCNEARAAGAAPLYRGQPGYRVEMDGDGDGIACEPFRRR